jgi:anti-anti-sigma factor
MVSSFVSSAPSAFAAAPVLSAGEAARAVAWLDRDGTRTAVWLDGEHDMATVGLLADALSKAIFIDDADLIVDLGGVTFIDAATIGVVIRARNILRPHARNLTMRRPQPCAARLLDLCGLTCLLDAA